MISKFFIERPIFAWVIAIGIMLAGIFAINNLAIAQYPDVAPPSVRISTSYTGASAETVENSVTQILEQQLTGLDGLMYFSSTSTSDGSASITATFEKGTDPDTAQVQVQNKVQQALARMPEAVQTQGLTVTKSNSDFLMVVALYDETDQSTPTEISDFLVRNYQDTLARVQGVGSSSVFGSEFAMRVWLDPNKLASFNLMPSDIDAAISSQNVEVSAGEIGALPALESQRLTATVTAKSKLETPEQFENIIVKSATDGSVILLKDVARVEMGQENYGVSARLNGHPGAGIAINLAAGADALETGVAVKAKIAELADDLPDGYKIAYPRDSTEFIKVSVEEVAETLIVAILLVIVVMYIFLQNWRATLIPAVAVPVVLLGTFGCLALFGYSINTLTMFGMVLAIGLLVDDAIVVVENVERVMREENLDPKAATIKSMEEIGSALIGIAVVVSAVLLPMAFFGGSTGVIYRQFSITIVSAMLLSVVMALILSPAMCATLLKRETAPSQDAKPDDQKLDIRGSLQRGFARFNDTFDAMLKRYVSAASSVIGKRKLHLIVYIVIVGTLSLLFLRLPTSFLPTEDQGQAMLSFQLPAGATANRTEVVREDIIDYFVNEEKDNLNAFFVIVGTSPNGSGQNAGRAFASLKDWSERTDASQSATAITQRATKNLSSIIDAQIIAMTPSPIQGLGDSSGFQFQLLNNSGMSNDEFEAARDRVIAAANADPVLTEVRAGVLPDSPQLKVDIDDKKVAALGLSETDVTTTLSNAWGGKYVNDFIDRGRVKKVYMQSDAQFRGLPEDISRWHVRSSDGSMTPFSSFSTTRWTEGPSILSRFNGISSYEIQGRAADGSSSGDAMERLAEIQQELEPGLGFAWSGLSYEEQQSSGQAPLLYALSMLVVFLCLAALYESWAIPFAVLMVVPLGLIGSVLAVTLRGLDNNIYFQVGLLTTIGLSAKNAILIVEFAELSVHQGKGLVASALDAARTRLRPILMTSLAFIVGVLPLAVASGAGAQSRIAIGTAVVGGTLTATFLAIFYVPMFFVIIAALFGHGKIDEAELEKGESE